MTNPTKLNLNSAALKNITHWLHIMGILLSDTRTTQASAIYKGRIHISNILTRSSTFRDADIRGGATFNWSPPVDVNVTLCDDAIDIRDWTPVFASVTDVGLCRKDDVPSTDDGPGTWLMQFDWDVNDGGDHRWETDVSSAMLNVSGAVGDDCFVSSTDVINCTKGGCTCTWLAGVNDDDGLIAGTDVKLSYLNIMSDGTWLLGLVSTGSLTQLTGSDRSSNSCFSITAGLDCRPVASNMCPSAKPFSATSGDGDIVGDCWINGANFSVSAAAPALAPVMSSSLLSSRSFRPTSCEVWKASADVDAGSVVAASSGLVGVPCFRRRRCSINGTAGGELHSGRVLDMWEPAVEKLGWVWCTADGPVILLVASGSCNDAATTQTLQIRTQVDMQSSHFCSNLLTHKEYDLKATRLKSQYFTVWLLNNFYN